MGGEKLSDLITQMSKDLVDLTRVAPRFAAGRRSTP
jgi:hypothetical protein